MIFTYSIILKFMLKENIGDIIDIIAIINDHLNDRMLLNPTS